MSDLTHLPIFRAVLLTLVISGICSIFFITDGVPGQPDLGTEAFAENTLIAEQQRMIEALHLRVDRIESTGVEQLIDDIRAELVDLRLQRNPSDHLLLPVTIDDPETYPLETSVGEVRTVQEFELREGVIPEAIVVVQGKHPRSIVSVEVLDRYNRWVEVYSGPDESVDPTSETWIECGELASTGSIRIEVMGETGIEAVGIAVDDSVHWSMASN
ncbi:MAG: hypothetical protein OSB09_02365 [Planctomycetota bacterium]|nr:hypothetical protein [Planctomycetota bacterium]